MIATGVANFSLNLPVSSILFAPQEQWCSGCCRRTVSWDRHSGRWVSGRTNCWQKYSNISGAVRLLFHSLTIFLCISCLNLNPLHKCLTNCSRTATMESFSVQSLFCVGNIMDSVISISLSLAREQREQGRWPSNTLQTSQPAEMKHPYRKEGNEVKIIIAPSAQLKSSWSNLAQICQMSLVRTSELNLPWKTRILSNSTGYCYSNLSWWFFGS